MEMGGDGLEKKNEDGLDQPAFFHPVFLNASIFQKDIFSFKHWAWRSV